MLIFLSYCFFQLIVAFLWLLDYKLVNRGLPQFPPMESRHRHASNERRRRGDSIEITTTQGIPIIVDSNVEPGAFYLVDTTSKKALLKVEDFT